MKKKPHTDNDLLAMIALKNGRALTMLYNRHYEVLCATAYKKIPDEAVVEEIVQDVFLVFWTKAPQLDISGDVKAYLFATLRNKVLYEMRSRMAKVSLASLFEPAHEYSSADAFNMLEIKELEQRIKAIIEDLPPQSREAFKLSRFEQMPYKMIAKQLDVSVGTVEKHISKALSVLRKEFKELDNSVLLLLVCCILKKM